MYILQSGTIDMMIGDTVIETIGANEALGFMSMIDDMPRSSTARAREDCELSLIDARTFRFMVDEVPNFSTYIMRVLARRIRGMSKAIQAGWPQIPKRAIARYGHTIPLRARRNLVFAVLRRRNHSRARTPT
jgi:CRP-like cAMP-binding protein